MTEAEWLTCEDPTKMLGFQYRQKNTTDRKYRLFAVACARDELDHASKIKKCFNFGMIEDYFMEMFWNPRDGYEVAILCAEAWADGREPQKYPSSNWFVGWKEGIDGVSNIAFAALGHDPDGLVIVREEIIAKTIQGYQIHPAHYLRDIFPFQPVAFSHEWRTGTVIALASQMDAARDFSAMPILADALMDAGCDQEDILNHCRGPGPHVRGCFVVDLLLSKE